MKILNKKGGIKILLKKEKLNSTQSWLQFNKILQNGIIKTNDKYIKIMKVIPINFNLKSEMEKEAILNSYKIFLKTYNSDIQILIQSKKEDLSKHVSCVESQKNNENEKIKMISQNYIEYIIDLNKKKKSSTKNFFIIIKSNNRNKEFEDYEALACDDLNEKYLKIKDCLSRCGNNIIDINEKGEVIKIFFSFLNSQKFIFE